MAKATYLLQGIKKEDNHQNRVVDILKKDHDEIIIYSAFIKESSIEDIKEELENNKGKVTALIGIRNGITSSQGVKCLLDAGVKVFVIDTGSSIQIFHPKTLVAINRKANTADVMIGSANFTPGGFLRNMENSAFLELDLTNTDDKVFLDSFLGGYNHLLKSYSADNVIPVDSEDVIADLLDEGRVIDEMAAPKISSVGKNSSGKQGSKSMSLQVGKHRVTRGRSTTTKTKSAIIVGNSFSGSVTEVWKSKELKERDLTIPSGKGTNPTGSMLLKKGAYDIDQQHYFRNNVFVGLNWAPKTGKPAHFEFASAKFHFIIDGIDNGTYTLTMKFDSRTNTAGYLQRQPNVHLSWGDAKGIIKNKNLLGQIMHLYSVDGKTDEFVIEIKED
ncbi:MAG: phospholipase D family protein [Lachnospiraceae bacterium]|nr:phospholipase D family protein [Lachnospiraceae bacterium]